ncbi:MAG: hypothetical protein KGQ59_05845 [Bdellovibrionales bacterium]|nr:hypothetical protein [Bdellovibrionales bacterium]
MTRKTSRSVIIAVASLLFSSLTACVLPFDGSELGTLPDSSKTDPVNPGGNTSASMDVLLFNGTGVSTSDWQSTEKIIASQGWSYQLVNTAELNAMSLDQLAAFRVMVFPGGSGGTIAGSLNTDARLRVRQAVRDRGVGYVGFCAGAWIAVGPEAEGDSVASYGLAVAKGAVLPYYTVTPGQSNPTAAMIPVTFSDQSKRELVWWGGPSTPEWSSGVIARYPRGEPAISETWSGKGLVVISGPHPEAPEGWRATAGSDADGLDFGIAIAMISAAMSGQPMAAY